MYKVFRTVPETIYAQSMGNFRRMGEQREKTLS